MHIVHATNAYNCTNADNNTMYRWDTIRLHSHFHSCHSTVYEYVNGL